MPVQLLCPNVQCGKTYSVSDEIARRGLKCRHCGTRLEGGSPESGEKDTNDALKGSSISDQSSQSSQQAELPKQIGPYQIRKSLGSGAFGQVFLAYDPKLDRQVALKVPHPGVLNSAKATERFLREAKAGARLHHANIVTVFDAGQDGPYHYIASVYIKGQTLQDALEKWRWDVRAAAEAVRQLALALAYAHQQGIVHRDVKPANVLMDDLGQLYLTDFGIASLIDASEKLTQTGAVMGTPAYMAPEVGQGTAGKTDPACDQYSLGVLLYELLCNQLPFTGMPGYVIHCHIHQAPKPPREIVGTIPPALETICLKAMAKKPADRYVDCKAMADALQKWVEAPPPVIVLAQLASERNQPGDVNPPWYTAIPVEPVAPHSGNVSPRAMEKRPPKSKAVGATASGGAKKSKPDHSKETTAGKDGNNPFVFDDAAPEVYLALPADSKSQTDAENLERARRLVRSPAITMIVFGCLGLVTPLLMGCMAMAMANTSDKGDLSPAALIVFSLFSLFVSGIAVLSGLSMINFWNYWLSMAGSIMLVCGIMGIAVGIWSLIVLSKPEVKSAFRFRSASKNGAAPRSIMSLWD